MINKTPYRFLKASTVLFSMSTLLCCVLPALFVLLGFGSVFATIVSNFPVITWFSGHKISLFIISGVLIVILAIVQKRKQSCPTDPQKAELCLELKKKTTFIYRLSLGMWLISFFFAFIAPHLFF